MYSKEEEKKFTSEYVKNFSLGQEQIKKNKNFNKALEIFNKCVDLAKKINNNQKLCESYYYNGLCYFTLYNLIESETNFNSSFSLINSFDQSNFPYYKIRGKVFAYIVHTNFLLKTLDENLQFINDNINNIINFKLEEKLVIFYNFIKEILYPFKKGNKFQEFKNEYYYAKNNILYNNENVISIKLKSIFLNLMNYQSMKLIFQKDVLLYYIDTYNIPSNHLIFNCLEKSDEFINEKSKFKIILESSIKSHKIKLDKEFNSTSLKLTQERKDLFDKFIKIWELLSLSFQNIFKNHLNITFTSSSKTVERKRVVTPNLVSIIKDKNSPSENKQPKSTKNNRRQSHITTSAFNENEKANFQKDIFIESFKTERTNENNEIDLSRVINSTKIISNTLFLRNVNPFLINTLISEFGKEKEIRKCDIINLKIPNYISSYSKLSRKGYHGLSLVENVNQDTVFLIKNLFLIKDLYFFGVCDGHGPSGHKISQIFTTLFQSFFLYNEMDNYLSKKKKSLNNYLSSLLSTTDENKNVKEMDIIKYFYTKLQINCNELSIVKNNFSELSTNIKESILNSQNELLKYSKDFDIQNSGSTICTLILKSNILTCINVGDSRAILISKNKNGTWNYSQLTKDHKPTEKEEKSRIENKGGLIHKIINYDDENKEIGPYRVWFKDDSKGPGLSMSRSFGDFLSKEIGVCCEPDIFRYELKEDDKFIVVASDGVWEFMSNELVMNTIINCSNAEDASQSIVKEAVKKWKEYSKKNVDDISCVVVEVCIKK